MPEVETLGQALQAGWGIKLRCARGDHRGIVKIDACRYTAQSRRQAIAIALNEAGNSKYKSDSANRRSEAKTERKEARGETAQQEKEGKGYVGAEAKRESSHAMGGKNATHKTAAGKRAANARVRGGKTKEQLYKQAQRADIPNRSRMTKTQLENALH